MNSITQDKNVSDKSARKVADALGKPVEKLFEKVEIETLAPKTVLYYHRLISSILSAAVKWQVIYANPCERVAPPKADYKEAAYLDETGAAKLLELLDKEDILHRTMIQMLLYTGLRRGELCGLEWKDIDFERSLLTVRRSSLYLPDRGVFVDDTKTQSSHRSIKLPNAAVDLLQGYRKWQLRERLRVGDQWVECDRLFTKWNGEPIHPDNISGWFRDFVRRNDLPQIHLHSLRHTNAALLISAGTNLQTVGACQHHHDRKNLCACNQIG